MRLDKTNMRSSTNYVHSLCDTGTDRPAVFNKRAIGGGK